ncbi:MAG: hypothetical protein M1820_001983 [Bogoriella megaspora]|nr:MAG: hypothetical protein M1820_001983 [Bogoriella megaspora]
MSYPHMVKSPYLEQFANPTECLGKIAELKKLRASLAPFHPRLREVNSQIIVSEAQFKLQQSVYQETKEIMDKIPKLSTTSLPPLSEDAVSATASPARGKEMRQNLLGKLRPPPLVHAWEFYHDRPGDRKKSTPGSDNTSPPSQQSPQKYEDRLIKLNDISDVRDFWETYNNFDISRLPLRDSIHLFHKGVKPLWEDPRNVKGGSWTFRVPKAQAANFWKEICMMAIGEKLQGAVESNRKIFIDDICGVSLSVRFTTTLIQIWNRDGDHKAAIDKILETVLENLPEELRPKDPGLHYYKKHSEHSGFAVPEGQAS